MKGITKSEPAGGDPNRPIAFGLIGVSVFATFHFINMPVLGPTLALSLFCFTISIPLNAFAIFKTDLENYHAYSVFIPAIEIVRLFGRLLCVAGFCAAIFHFSTLLGTLFLVTSLLLVLFYIGFYQAMMRVNQADEMADLEEASAPQESSQAEDIIELRDEIADLKETSTPQESSQAEDIIELRDEVPSAKAKYEVMETNQF
jgi:hypothetical protein